MQRNPKLKVDILYYMLMKELYLLLLNISEVSVESGSLVHKIHC